MSTGGHLVNSRSLFNLDGKVALITGGATGIGRACAEALASAGATVVISDVHERRGQEAASSMGRDDRSVLFISCDVSKSDAVRSTVDRVAAEFGRLDIAVNSAGIFQAGDDASYSETDWDRVMAVNLKGTWLCAREELRQMARQMPPGGKIINIASIAAHMAVSNGAYDASKAAIVGLTRTLAVEGGRHSINVNCLSPGYVSPVFGAERSPEEQAKLVRRTPLGRVQRVADLQGPLLFLASAASDYLTGQNLVVDGGHTLSTWLVLA